MTEPSRPLIQTQSYVDRRRGPMRDELGDIQRTMLTHWQRANMTPVIESVQRKTVNTNEVSETTPTKDPLPERAYYEARIRELEQEAVEKNQLLESVLAAQTSASSKPHKALAEQTKQTTLHQARIV